MLRAVDFTLPTAEVEESNSEPTMQLTGLERKQEVLKHYVKMVAGGQANGLLCFGSGGNGKSTVVTETLSERNIQPILLNSHLTPLGLFGVLWTYRSDSIILIEDCEQSLSNAAVLGLLRSALSGVSDERRVTYTSSQQFDMPPSFRFDSRIILCANAVPKTEAFKALLSRCLVYHLEPTQEEILEQFHLLAAKGFTSPDGEYLAPDLCSMVVDFVATTATRRLNMRLLVPVFRTVLYAKAEAVAWEPLVENQLQELLPTKNVAQPVGSKQQEVRCLEEALARFPDSPKDQVRCFMAKSGRSRATFFRRKAEWERQRS